MPLARVARRAAVLLALGTAATLGTACRGADPVRPHESTPPDTTTTAPSGQLELASRSRPLAAPLGGSLFERPTVRLVDAAGRGVAGATVHFRVEGGGGRVTGADVRTDANGVARVGDWTLGATPEENVLRAEVDGGGAVQFSADAVTHPAGEMDRRVDLPGGPYSVAISRAHTLMVTRHYTDSLTRVSLQEARVLGSTHTGRDPVEVAFDWDGDFAFVTHQFNDNVGVVDVATGEMVSTIPVGGDPWRVKPNPDHTLLYVTSNVGIITEIDPATKRAVGSVNFGVPINGVAFHPNDTLVYFTAKTVGTLFELNRWTRATRSLAVGGFPQEVVLGPDAREMYIADETQQVLQVRSVATGDLLASIPLGGGGFGVAISPDSAQLYVTLSQWGKVVVVDRAARAVVKTIDTGGVPRRVAFTRFGTYAIIPNEAGWVDIIR